MGRAGASCWGSFAIYILITFLTSISNVYAQTEAYGKPAGFIRIQVPAQAQKSMSYPLIPFNNGINSVLSGQLTGETTNATADKVSIWDISSQQYIYAFKADNTGDGAKDGKWFFDDTTWTPSTITFSPGKGFFIHNNHGATQNVFILGKLPLDDSSTVSISQNQNLVGYPYPVSINLNSTSFFSSGATGAISQANNPDILSTILPVNQFWLYVESGQPNSGLWFDTSNNLASLLIPTATAFWYSGSGVSGFSWTENRPYLNPFNTAFNAPSITALTLNAALTELTITYSCTGTTGEVLEIFYKDIIDSQSPAPDCGWFLAVENINTNSAITGTWTDQGSTTPARDNITVPFMRIYMISRQDIDSDSDGVSDGREIFIYGTDPAIADSDEDGLSDGDEINSYGTDPNDTDSDNDGLTDSAELNTYSTNPLSADSDGDTINDDVEIANGTNPNNTDTDSDGIDDNVEIANNYNPLVYTQIIYVDNAKADDSGDGLSLATAKKTISGALSLKDSSKENVIKVVAGTYSGSNNRNFDFGGTDVKLVSISGKDVTIIDLEQSNRFLYVHCGESLSSEVSGFTFKNGTSGDGSVFHVADSSSLKLNDLKFESCTGSCGVIDCNNAYVEMTNVTIDGSTSGEWDWGGAMRVRGDNGSLKATDCVFTNNSAGFGGVIYVSAWSEAEFDRCVFKQNSANYYGGVFYVEGGELTLTNCLMTGNTAQDNYAVIYCESMYDTGYEEWWEGELMWAEPANAVSMTNVTSFGNSAANGKTMRLGGEDIIILNSVLRGAIDGTIDSINYSNAIAAYSGTGNITSDPLLNTQGYLAGNSPCIDTGSTTGAPASDLDVQTRPVGNGVDMGCYEYKDTDSDGIIDVIELAAGLDPNNPNDAVGDKDGDTISNIDEYNLGTDINNVDTDGDGINDNTEIDIGYDPLKITRFFYVDSTQTDDSGDGLSQASAKKSIGAAVTVAKNSGTENIIRVADGTYNGSSNRDIVFDGYNIKIEGADKATTIIDLEGQGRFLYLQNGENLQSKLSNVTVKNGQSDRGGAVRIGSAGITLEDVIFIDNHSTWRAGALMIENGIVKITNCEFISNTASENAGAMSQENSSVEVISCLFRGNAASGNVGAFMIYGNSAVTSIFKCVFNGNSANDTAGAIRVENYSNTTVTNCLFMNNSAGNYGGAVYHYNDNAGSLKFVNCTMLNNRSKNTSGIKGNYKTELLNCIINDELSNMGTVTYSRTMYDFVGDGNITAEANLNGSGMLITGSPCINAGSSASAPLTDILGESRPVGSGVDMGCYEFKDSDLDGIPDAVEVAAGLDPNNASDASGDKDGDTITNLDEYNSGTDINNVDTDSDGIDDNVEIANNYNPLVYTQIIYVDNAKADDTGDGLSLATAKKTISAALLLKNNSKENVIKVAAGTYTGSGNRDMDFGGTDVKLVSISGKDVTIIDLEQSNRFLYVHCGESLSSEVSGFTFKNGTSGDGSVFHVADSSSLKLNDLKFESCTGSCGVIDCNNAYVEMTNVTIDGSTSGEWDWGGAMRVRGDNGSLKATDCVFTNNSAGFGGVIYVSAWSEAEFDRCVFKQNSANYYGGVFYVEGGELTLTNCLMTGNTAQDNYAVIYCESMYDTGYEEWWEGELMWAEPANAVSMTNVTSFGNSAANGKTMRLGGEDIIILNSILRGTIDGTIDSINYSNAIAAYSGTGNITSDPLLDSYGKLTSSSPCVDTGITNGAPTIDLEGETRPYGSGIDMGCYEFRPPNDTDGDGLTDDVEIANGLNPNDPSDAAADADNDGLTNAQEISLGTALNNSDSDSDGLIDGLEVSIYNTNPIVADSDSDGIDDGIEVTNGLDPNDPSDAATDADGDGLTNTQEVTLGTDLNNEDSDSDGLTDGVEVNTHGTNPLSADSDSDGIPDAVEISVGLNPNSATDATLDLDGDGVNNLDEYLAGTAIDVDETDTDGDGLIDLDEVALGTDPNIVDSDSDGLTDGAEVNTHSTNPLSADSDGDTISDGDEINTYNSNPLIADSDGDGINDGTEVASGMNPAVAALQGSGYVYEQKLLDNAEDGDTAGWSIIDNDPEASLSNITDPDDANNKVIRLDGTYGNIFKYDISPDEETMRKLSMRVKFDGQPRIYIAVDTNVQSRLLIYDTAFSTVSADTYNVNFPLPAGYAANTWQTFIRDIKADLKAGYPNEELIRVKHLMFRGNGHVDNIKFLAYVDSDSDGIPDSVETNVGLNPNDAADATGDKDGDTINNIDEFNLGTNINSTDSDSDGLNDGAEINTYNSNPLIADSDGDGINDGTEVASGMNPAVAALQGSGYVYEQKLLDNAEDGDTAGWSIIDNDPEASLSNITDPDDANNKVIRLDGTYGNIFKYDISPDEETMRKLSMRVKFDGQPRIYIAVDTNVQSRLLIYDTAFSTVSADTYNVNFPLPAGYAANTWQTFIRDIKADLKAGYPNEELIRVKHLMFRGNGYVDDIKFLAYVDSDSDGIPDSVETNVGLDPEDASDGAADLDSDGLANLDEFVLGTDMNNVDSDSDGLEDGAEVHTYFTDPFTTDSDGDGINDGTEVASGMNPAVAALQGSGYVYEQKLLDNAEDGDTAGWSIIDNDPEASLSNITDPDDANNKVIRLDGTYGNIFKYDISPDEETMRKLSMRVKFDGQPRIYIAVDTNVQSRLLIYDTAFSSISATADNVNFPLPAGYAANAWQAFIRDIKADIKAGFPNEELVKVKYLMFRGNGYVDDINFLAYVDSDSDGIPDSVETNVGLNSNDAADALLDDDGDGVSNVDEFWAGTPFMAVDSDGDGIMDHIEIANGMNPNDPSDADEDADNDALTNSQEILLGTNVNNSDTDSDGLTDGEEVSMGTNPLNIDTDSDGLTDGDEVNYINSNPLVATKIVYVDNSRADNSGDGLSLASAKKTLSAAIALKESSKDNVIRVAAGTYSGTDNRNLDLDGINIKIRSIDGRDSTIIDLEQQGRFLYLHNGETNDSEIAGFTIRNGQSDNGSVFYFGGSSAKLSDLRIEDCHSPGSSGVIYCDNANLVMNNVLVSGCSASDWGGVIRLLGDDGSLSATECQFIGNSATNGGVLYLGYKTQAEFNRCVFTTNHSTYYAGVFYVDGSELTLTNCLIRSNSSGDSYSVIYCEPMYDVGYEEWWEDELMWSEPANAVKMVNVTSFNNISINDTDMRLGGEDIIILNSIILDKITGEVDSINYCNTTDDYTSAGVGNSIVNPTLNANGFLIAGSSCIDAGTLEGSPETDLEGTARPVGSGVDMGCYEFKDSDSDGIPDNVETAAGLDPNNASDASGDKDSDGLNNLAEYEAGSDINKTDTDNDGIDDNAEISLGYDPAVYTKIIYVDASKADDSGDGLSLATAKQTISGAVSVSQDTVNENVILVAPGTYSGSGNRNIDFGSYDIKLRSIDGAASTIIDLENSGRFIYLHTGETQESLLDGFTVRNGYANVGGAVRLNEADMIIKNNIFEDNCSNNGSGGAIYSEYGNPIIDKCKFINNIGNATGGAIMISNKTAKISNCEITGNFVDIEGAGGGIAAANAEVYVSNCIISRNKARNAGGAFYSDTSSFVISNCLIYGNSSMGDYGFMYSKDDASWCVPSSVDIINSTIFDNTSRASDNSFNVGISNINLKNCIVNGQFNGSITSGSYTGLITVNNSCLPVDCSAYGSGNIMSDPQLTAVGMLKSTSPCIDAGTLEGSPETDLEGTARPVGSGVDMGCYEFKDSDSDGIPDNVETAAGLDPNNASDASGDKDSDGLNNLAEYEAGSDINKTDTDNDGIDDNAEISLGYDPAVYTKIIYVDASKADDSGDGLSLATAKQTISGAVSVSQDTVNENVILVAPGTYSGSGNRNIDFGSYDIKLRSIDGAASTIIDLENSGRFIYLHTGETQESLLDGFTVRKGYANGGGAVRLNEADMIIKNNIFEDNDGGYGGAIYSEYGNPIIDKCKFINNTADCYGGAIMVLNETAKISNCEITGNFVDIEGAGGGIAALHADVYVSKCILSRNKARNAGGAFYSDTSSFVISNCLIYGNSSMGDYGFMYSKDDASWCVPSSVDIINSTIFDNTSRASDNSFNVGISNINLKNCIVNGQFNGSITSGSYTGLITVNNSCLPVDCSAYGSGNIMSDPQLTAVGMLKSTSPCIDAGTLEGSPETDLEGTARPVGSGVDMGCYEFKDSDSDGIPDNVETAAGLDPNNASDASGDKDSDGLNNLAEYEAGSDINKTDTDNDGIDDNAEISLGYDPAVYTKIIYVDASKADDSGDGLSLATAKQTISGAVSVSQDTVNENVILVAPGTYSGSGNRNIDFGSYDIKLRSIDGAASTIIDLENSGRFIYLHTGETQESLLDGFTVRKGYANGGGAVRLNEADMIIKNNIFEDNDGGYGGAIYSEYGNPIIDKCKFINNTADCYGGAIMVLNETAKISNCEITGNFVDIEGAGGGIAALHADVYVSKCILSRNKARNAGGAFYSDTSSFVISNCLVYYNSSMGDYGFMYVWDDATWCAPSSVDIVNSTIFDNASRASDNNFNVGISDISMTNCIMDGTFSDSITDGSFTGAITVNNSCLPVDCSAYGSGNIMSDPQLTAVGMLKSTSPCIDAGALEGSPETDLEGTARPVGSGVDMGCYEFKDSDSDGIPDNVETAAGLDPNNASDASGDKDFDGLNNLAEYEAGSDINKTDTDNDGIDDNAEISLGYDPAVYTKIIYVDASKPDDSFNGLSLSMAKKTISAAVSVSQDTVNENVILVAPGTYSGSGNRNIDFGSYDIKLRSIDGAASTIIDLENSGRFIYLHTGETQESLLDGFTVRNGYANGGGAVRLNEADMTIVNNTFEGNDSHDGYGGAIFSEHGNAIINKCKFTNNTGYGHGGAIMIYYDSAEISNCEISDNVSIYGTGGGIAVATANVNVSSCVISKNAAERDGGAVYVQGASSNILTNCLFTYNYAGGTGGVSINKEGSYQKMLNCTLFNNDASNVTGIQGNGSNKIVNCIINDELDNIVTIDEESGAVVAGSVTYSLTKYDYNGIGNINADANLTGAGMLKTGSIYNKLGTSTGAPETDLMGETRSADAIGIGCYKFVDSDKDGIPDVVEIANGLNPRNPADALLDKDGDLLCNVREYYLGTDICNKDTNGDGMDDREEIQQERIPFVSPMLIYVDANNGNDTNNGGRDSAKKTIAGALSALMNLDNRTSIRVRSRFVHVMMLLRPGVYSGPDNRNLICNLPGIGLSISSTSPSEKNSTIIDLGQQGKFISVRSELYCSGLTINNGLAEYGGVFDVSSYLKVTNCTFISNKATQNGGVVSFSGGRAVFERCIFTQNSAENIGGVFSTFGSNLELTNCLISGNTAKHGGSVIDSSSSYAGMITMTNVTSFNNVSNTEDEDVDEIDMVFHDETTVTIMNCIIRDQISENIDSITYSNTLNIDYGDGNITDDPQLNSSGYLLSTSPCIDAGNDDGAPTHDLNMNMRKVHGEPMIGVELTATDMGCFEYAGDSDGDGIPDDIELEEGLNPNDPSDAALDADDDGVSNLDEYLNETEINVNNNDSDNDGLIDTKEVEYGTDPNVADSDGDGLSDGDEVYNYKTDPSNSDSDGDGLDDQLEIVTYKTDPLDADTDNDGLDDFAEVNMHMTNPLKVDSDNDGIPDAVEVFSGMRPNDPRDAYSDIDGDGVSNYQEYINGTNINDYNGEPDSDGDGLCDAREIELGTDPNKSDTDSDGLNDGMEVVIIGTNPLKADSDSDGLNDADEVLLHNTDPLMKDSDSDGLSDEDEIKLYNTDPLNADSDNDTLSDGDEINTYKTNPMDSDSDNDGVNDNIELESGMDPNNTAIQGNGYLYEQRVIEDAEDGLNNRWTSLGASASNIVDPDNYTNRVIQYGYHDYLALSPVEQTKKTISWRMKSEGGTISIKLFTSEGIRYITYLAKKKWNPAATVNIALGESAFNNTWQTFTRSLQRDLKTGFPDAVLISVDAIWVNGKGLIDDITLISFADADGDGIPDSVELASGLNPYDAEDSLIDSDGDNVINIDEFIAGTDINDADTDNDGLNDGEEINNYKTDPLNADSDGDTISDALEVNTYHTDPLSKDTDQDSIEDNVEIANGTNPSSAIIPDAEYIQDIRVLDDAEDGTLDRWVADDYLLGITSNVIDPDDENNRVIKFNWPTYLGSFVGAELNLDPVESSMKLLSWRMKLHDQEASSNHYFITIELDTNEGLKKIVYQDTDYARVVGSTSIFIPLGNLYTGSWKVFIRNLSTDLKVGFPNATINNVKRISYKFHGYIDAMIDDVKLFSFKDTDNDGLRDIDEDGYGTNNNDIDTDGDTLTDGDEVHTYKTDPLNTDTDGDEIPDDVELYYGLNPNDPSDAAKDMDGDGISNVQEYKDGTDMSVSDKDTDEDGLKDVDEAGLGTDPNVVDTDGDGLSDGVEVLTYCTSPLNSDTDGDGLSDGDEINIHHTDPLSVDTDSDGIPDNIELDYGLNPNNASDAAGDMDGDGDSNVDEYNNGTAMDVDETDSDGDGLFDIDEAAWGTEPYVADTDGDGLTDGEEVYVYHTMPLIIDTDMDDLSDGDEVNIYGTDPLSADSDSDGIPDKAELDVGLDPNKASDATEDLDGDGVNNIDEYNAGTAIDIDETDSDGDGLIDIDEVIWGTAPDNDDSDSDGLTDGMEVHYYGTDPLNNDTDSDGLSDGDEVNIYNTDPLSADSDSDGIPDKVELDVGLNPNYALDAAGDLDEDNVSNLDEYINGTKINLDETDSDNDGIPDVVENDVGLDPNDASDATGDLDGDGVNNLDEYNGGTAIDIDERDPDSDGLNNSEEDDNGTNRDLADTDGDGVSDGDEVNIYHTDPLSADSDSDGIPDKVELDVNLDPNDATDAAQDLDGDGISNLDEHNNGSAINIDERDPDSDGLNNTEENEAGTNPNIADTDDDGLTDGDEVHTHHTDPNLVDTDGDSLSDGDEVNIHGTDPLLADTDSDGIPDDVEINVGLNPNNASDATGDLDGDGVNNLDEYINGTPIDINYDTLDSDSDGLTNAQEAMRGTDPDKADTDGDGLNDGDEVNSWHSDPLKEDTDEDGLNDGDEYYLYSTNMLLADSDNDGLNDKEEIITYETDPNKLDTDGDSLGDGDEVKIYKTDPNKLDTDGDTINDNIEIANGMNPNSAATQGSGYLYDEFVLENAEDGLTSGWIPQPDRNLMVSNVIDSDNVNNRVIKFMGLTTYYQEINKVGTLSWRMKSSDLSSSIKVILNTTVGQRYICYNASSQSSNSTTVNIPLGERVYDGKWRTFNRDLRSDLQSVFTTATINSITGIIVNGSGYIDDVKLILFIDADKDGIPDSVESAAGLSSENSSDAKLDKDQDGINNLDEFHRGTDINDSDSDDDGLSDGVECNTYNTNPLLGDTDSDGLSDGDEVTVHHTDPLEVDSDSDGLSDGDEINTYNTEPMASDTDSDGLNDGDEVYIYKTQPANADTDGDNLIDGDEINNYNTDPCKKDTDSDGIDDDIEIANNMNPNSAAVLNNGYLLEQRIIEDAEDGLTSGWSEFTNTNASVSNINDPDVPDNKLIQFQGSGTLSGFEINLSPAEKCLRKIFWRMKFSEAYIIYVKLNTSEGDRYIAYTPTAQSFGSDTVNIQLGADTCIGGWRVFVRNLKADLKTGFPDAVIDGVSQIRICGSGMVDDIKLMGFIDSDGDGIPDSVEDANNLDKNDASDANADIDNDNLLNFEEILYNTDINNSDTDGDGISDGNEIKTYASNPNSKDSDKDGLSDTWELINFGNQSQTPGGDHDNDGLTNLEEDCLGLSFSKVQEFNDSIELNIYTYCN